jgi:anti-anti-sigma factor
MQTSGPWKIVVVDGEMDIVVLPLLPDLRGGVAAQVVFDLLGVTFMDASALGALIGRQQRVTRSGGCMRLVAQAGPVLRLLSMTGTSDVFCTFDTLDRALHAPIPIGPHEAA